MRIFVMGDLHGAYLALRQCLDRSGFEKEEDLLIQLGDVTDRCDQVFECVEELLQLSHLIAIRGNHDYWFLQFIQSGIHLDGWWQGGEATARSYLRQIGKEHLVAPFGDAFITSLTPSDIPESHRQFFKQQQLYYIDDQDNCFVHAGFDRSLEFRGQSPETYMWDRELWNEALSFEAGRKGFIKGRFRMVTRFREVFIGHTPTLNWNKSEPMHAANVWNLDTGAGWDARLTIMDVRSKEFWQSDPVSELYKGQ
jgi:serine/threonine protein phosphatase 1